MNNVENGDIKEMTLRSIVTQSIATAATFEKYGLDFCCHGNVALNKACADKNVSEDQVTEELKKVLAQKEDAGTDFNTLPLGELINHIVSKHHTYVREKLPIITTFMDKVVNAHSKNHPEVLAIAELFMGVRLELESHLIKEERILFPLIKKIEEAKKQNIDFPAPMSVKYPIHAMESEHTSAGDALQKIKELSSDYNPPSDACNTFKALYYELSAFENDLHIHIHLENNILFPKAILLEGE